MLQENRRTELSKIIQNIWEYQQYLEEIFTVLSRCLPGSGNMLFWEVYLYFFFIQQIKRVLLFHLEKWKNQFGEPQLNRPRCQVRKSFYFTVEFSINFFTFDLITFGNWYIWRMALRCKQNYLQDKCVFHIFKESVKVS